MVVQPRPGAGRRRYHMSEEMREMLVALADRAARAWSAMCTAGVMEGRREMLECAVDAYTKAGVQPEKWVGRMLERQ
jgi:hypothetical protein